MRKKKAQEKTRMLGIFSLAMINVAAIESLKNFPIMAKMGYASIFFYGVAALLFFIPCALVSAELATGWPSRGGVYTWVKEGINARWGFVAIWLQWIENVFWYPTILSFAAATLAYLVNPDLANNKYYMLAVILTTFWGFTLINFMGMKASGFISTFGVIVGTIVPGAAIILLGLSWFVLGKPLQITFSMHALLPNITHISNIVFLVGVLLSLCGMEMSAVHAMEVENPQKDYPRAIFLSTFAILVLSILGSLAIALIVPAGDVSLVAGIMQAFTDFLEAFHVGWLEPIVALMIAIGAIGMTSTWIVGPTKGILQTAKEGCIPPIFQRTNKHNMPVAILLLQAIFLTIMSFAFLLMPTVSSSFWILTDLTAQLYLIMYVLMFVAAIRLRYSQPHVKRSYRIPGGRYAGMLIVGGVGAIASLAALIIGFIPPSQLSTGNIWVYEGFLFVGVLLMCILPLFIFSFRREGWKTTEGVNP